MQIKQFLSKRWVVSLFLAALVALLSLPAVYELLRPGYYSNHDGEGHIIRLQEFDIALKEGHFPPRMDKNLMWGYGYYFFNFNYPLVYWTGEAAHLLGLDYIDAIKAVSVLGLVLSGVTMFYWQRHYWGVWGAVVAAVFYMYAPYRLLTLYVRGSLAEHIAFVMLPLLFLFAERIAEAEKKRPFRYALWGGLAYALLMLSHNITAFIFSLMLGIFMLFHVVILRNLKLIVYYGLMIGTGMALSAYFWLPAIMEKGFVRLDQTIGQDYPDHFVYFFQLIQRSWGFGGSGAGPNDGLSFQVGVMNLIFLLLAIPAAFYLWKKVHEKALHIFLFFLLFIISVFFMLPISKPLWDNLPLLPFTQFPWRFLSWSVFTTSILAGTATFALGQVLKGRFQSLYLLAVAVILAVLIGTSQEYWQVNQRVEIKLPGDRPIAGSTTWADEQFPVWFDPKPTDTPTEQVEIAEGQGEVKINSWKTAQHEYEIITDGEVKVVENTAYYPGWKLRVADVPYEFEYQDSQYPGRLVYRLPAGEHKISSVFGETPLRTRANLVTLASFVLVVLGLLSETVLSRLKKY